MGMTWYTWSGLTRFKSKKFDRGMKKNYSELMAYFFVLSVVFVVSVHLGGCSRHLAPAVAKANDTPKARSGLRDTLIGTWTVLQIEAPDMSEKMREYGDQSNRESMTISLARYKDALIGLEITFSEDSSYTVVTHQQGDIGKWMINKDGEVEAVSKTTERVMVYQILSSDGRNLTVKFNPGEMVLTMTLVKK
jgi:hypothetical protein